ncbi:MAG: glycosyltransferase family 39 protein [Patescibacteria group bacterium]|nr:glycosyltransferase family 39 protein [Patescibacteria group bacterium]
MDIPGLLQMKKHSLKKQKYYLLGLLIIVIFGSFLRLYKIDHLPIQLGHDEVTQLYDAISIKETGKDIYGEKLPFIFRSVNDFKPPFYTYASLLPLLIFGWQDLTIKIIGVFFGIMIIPAMYFFTQRLLLDQKIAIIAAFLTAIAPFEIFYSRKSFESGAGIFASLLGFGFLLSYINNKRHRWYFLVGSVILAFGLYTYFSHALIIPILYISFIILYHQKLELFNIKLSKYVLFGIVSFLLISLPLIRFIFTDPNSINRSEAVIIIQDPALGKKINEIPTTDPNFSIKKDLVIARYSINRYLSQFDPYFIFGNGLDLTNTDPIDSGLLYFFQLPLLLIGIITITRNKKLIYQKRFIIMWILIGAMPSGLTFEAHSPHRIIMVFTMLDLISAYGLYQLWLWVCRFKRPLLNRLFLSFIAILIIWNASYFATLYTINYAFDKSEYLQYPLADVARFAWSQHDNYNLIIFDPTMGEYAPFVATGAYYYLAYYGHYSPLLMQQELRLGNQKIRETLFDKFDIREVNWGGDMELKGDLVISSPWSLSPTGSWHQKIIHTFYYYDGKPAFYAVAVN